MPRLDLTCGKMWKNKMFLLAARLQIDSLHLASLPRFFLLLFFLPPFYGARKAGDTLGDFSNLNPFSKM